MAKIEIELPDEYNKFLEYLEMYFFIDKEEYIKNIVESEILSRNLDLNIF